MPYCPECRSEYRDEYTECASCKVALIAALPELPPDAAEELADLAERGEAAHVARAPYDEACRMEEVLASRGVAALVVADPETKRHGAYQSYFLCVRPADIPLAHKCLKAEFEALIAREGLTVTEAVTVDLDSGSPITCPACGTTFPPANECPECGLFVGAPE